MIVLGICQHDGVQLDLFAQANNNDQSSSQPTKNSLALIAIIDELNKEYGQNNK